MYTQIVVLLLIRAELLTSCQCGGVEIAGTDQKHCWEVRTRAAKTWVDADITCQRLGGHLGHPQSYNKKLIEYINKVYSKPILTGIVAGNVETQKYAILCPNNAYFGLVDFHEIKNIIIENATSTNTCAFLTDLEYKMTFAPCDTDSHVLCDRPMEKLDYCNTMMNCSSTKVPYTPTSVFTKLQLTNTMSTESLVSSTSPVPFTTKISPSTSSIVQINMTAKNTVPHTSVRQLTSPPISPDRKQCGNNQWRIFGMCADWRLLLLLSLLLLCFMILLCVCHCCCKVCIGPCRVKSSENEERVKMIDAPLPPPSGNTNKDSEIIIVTTSPRLNYSPEPESTLIPPSAVLTQPIFVPIPMENQDFIYDSEAENRVIPPKVECRSIGTNTDPINIPVFKENKKMLKSQQYFVTLPTVPSTPEFVDDDTLADDVSLELEHLSGSGIDFLFKNENYHKQYIFLNNSFYADTESIYPTEDAPSIVPAVFAQNVKPSDESKGPLSSMEKPKLIGESSSIFSGKEQQKSMRTLPVLNSPNGENNILLPGQIHQNASRVNSNKVKRSDSTSNYRTSTSKNPEVEKRSSIPHHANPNKSYQKRPNSRLPAYSHHPFSAKLRSTSTPVKKISKNPSVKQPLKAMQQEEVSMLAPKGKMGGVVKAGKDSGGETPVGWRPWAKSSDTFSTQPQFLNVD